MYFRTLYAFGNGNGNGKFKKPGRAIFGLRPSTTGSALRPTRATGPMAWCLAGHARGDDRAVVRLVQLVGSVPGDKVMPPTTGALPGDGWARWGTGVLTVEGRRRWHSSTAAAGL
jgi:hypothetical protein